ncbi:hypothetical protein BHE74_00024828 [Ensete ventricosum]|nr:hypothetical protein BHE74_00024828 [Ensete ventricosum]
MHLLDCDPLPIQFPLHPSRSSNMLNLLRTSAAYGRSFPCRRKSSDAPWRVLIAPWDGHEHSVVQFVAKIQTYSKNLGTGGSPANVSDAFAESTLKTAYGRFSRQPRRFNCPKTWAMAIQPLLTAGSTEFAEGIGKLARNMLGNHRKMTVRLTTRMPKATKLGGLGNWAKVRTMQWDLVGSSPKGSKSSLGTHREIAERKS